MMELMGPSVLECTMELDMKSNQNRYVSSFSVKNTQSTP